MAKAVVLNWKMNHRDLLTYILMGPPKDSNSVGLEWDLSFYIFNKVSAAAEAAGLRTMWLKYRYLSSCSDSWSLVFCFFKLWILSLVIRVSSMCQVQSALRVLHWHRSEAWFFSTAPSSFELLLLWLVLFLLVTAKIHTLPESKKV